MRHGTGLASGRVVAARYWPAETPGELPAGARAHADVAQLAARHPPKVKIAGSNPVVRSSAKLFIVAAARALGLASLALDQYPGNAGANGDRSS